MNKGGVEQAVLEGEATRSGDSVLAPNRNGVSAVRARHYVKLKARASSDVFLFNIQHSIITNHVLKKAQTTPPSL